MTRKALNGESDAKERKTQQIPSTSCGLALCRKTRVIELLYLSYNSRLHD